MLRAWICLAVAALTLHFSPWPVWRLIALAGGLAWVISLVWTTIETAARNGPPKSP